MFPLQDQCDIFFKRLFNPLPILRVAKPPVSCAQKNMTISRNFLFWTGFKNVWWRWSLIWISQAFPRYPVVVLNVSFTSLSNTPQFQQSSQNICAWIFLELLLPWSRCSITDWNLSPSQSSTSKLLHCRDPHKWSQQNFSQFYGCYVVALGWHIY